MIPPALEQAGANNLIVDRVSPGRGVIEGGGRGERGGVQGVEEEGWKGWKRRGCKEWKRCRKSVVGRGYFILLAHMM